MTSKYLHKFIIITWEDAWASDDYWTVKEAAEEKPITVETMGYCIKDDKTGMATTRSIRVPFEPTRCRGVHLIPRGMIKKVRILK